MLTTDQKAGQLYKHFLNVSDTRDTRDFYEEAIQSSFCIRPDQLLMYGDEIPRGQDEKTVAMIRNLKDGEYYDWQKDETTVIHIVQYHENYPLKKIDDGTDNAFKIVDDDGNLIQNIIPFNYYRDLYNYDLRTNAANGSKKIYFGVGDWVLDTYSGVLKFYGDVPTGVDHNNPPTLSFYQYVGGTGFRQDTFGYDGVIVPIQDWHISAGSYIIDGINTKSDGTEITLEEQISENANAIQDGYTGTFGFDGADTNEGVAYSLQKIISLTYSASLDNVKGYDESAKSDIGTLLSRKKATTDNLDLKITFCSQNVSIVDTHNLVVLNGTVSFDGGLSKTISGPTKIMDTNGNFLIVEKLTETLKDGEYIVSVIEDTTVGILLYWSKSERDYVPFINQEDDYYNFGFPVVAANGRIPPSVGIGAISLNNYTDSITPEYYGPRNYTITIALENGDQVKSADYLVKNHSGYYLDDIFKRIISDYTDDEGNFNFVGSIFMRAGTYKLSGNTLDLSLFSRLNLIGEDKNQTTINGNVYIKNSKIGIITISNLSISEKIQFLSSTSTLYLNEIICSDFTSTKSNNALFIKNSSLSTVTVEDSGVKVLYTGDEPRYTVSDNSESSENSEDEETDETTDYSIYNNISGSTIGSVSINTGHSFLSGNNIARLKLFDVKCDVIRACFIQKVLSKPSQTTLVGCTVFEYSDTPFVEIPHMCHFPIYSKYSDKCLEYATFDNPFRINYSQYGNKIGIALDSEYLYIDDEGRLSCNLNAGSIIVDVNQLVRNKNYEGDSPEKAIPTKNLQEALNDLYSTKADLNPNGKIPLEEIPDSIAYGGLLYVGTWSFEYKDVENAAPGDNGYVDGGGYPKYEDAIKNLTVDKTQDEGLEPGWFWIVSSSKKDDDKPAAVQNAAPQKVYNAIGEVVYEDNGLVFTAGDWVIWNGTNFEKLDRAYQDAAYAVLPIYTTGEHLCWSWRSNEENKKWGLGALELGGVTIAESFDMVNQELRKLWVKHPAIFGNIELEPYYDNYKTLSYYPIVPPRTIPATLNTAYDLLKDERVKDFRVKTPQTEPRWKSGVFVGDSCTIVATVDGESTKVDYTPSSVDTTLGNVHISGAFDPFVDEISGNNYWKAVYVDFAGKDFEEGSHKFILSMTDIQPNNTFTKDAISSTPVFGIDTVKKYNYAIDGFVAEVDESTITLNNTEISELELKGSCSGVPNVTEPFNMRFGFIIRSALDCINSDRIFLQFVDEVNNNIVDIPVGNLQFTTNSETGLYDIRVQDFIYEFPVDKNSTEQKFSIILYDVYKNAKKIPNFFEKNIRVSPYLSESERVSSGKGLYPTVDVERSSTCGYPFTSSQDLKASVDNELMKRSRTVNDTVVQDYGWPDELNICNSKAVDYRDTNNSDVISDDLYDGEYRWVTFAKLWNGEDYEFVDLQENSGFTLDINVAEDVESYFNTDVYTMSTNNDEIIIMGKLVNYDLVGDCSLTSWFNCNLPYDGFAEVGTENGQAAMYAGSSNVFSKRITFGTKTYSGTLIFRVGIKKDSKLRIKNLSVRDLI